MQTGVYAEEFNIKSFVCCFMPNIFRYLDQMVCLGLLLFCVLFSTLAWKGVLAMYDSSDDVYGLRADNFQQMVINSDFVWVVEFYAPW